MHGPLHLHHNLPQKIKHIWFMHGYGMQLTLDLNIFPSSFHNPKTPTSMLNSMVNPGIMGNDANDGEFMLAIICMVKFHGEMHFPLSTRSITPSFASDASSIALEAEVPILQDPHTFPSHYPGSHRNSGFPVIVILL